MDDVLAFSIVSPILWIRAPHFFGLGADSSLLVLLNPSGQWQVEVRVARRHV
jgi:hypothetical protein